MIVLVTGSAGLVGSEAVRFFCGRGDTVIGVDNNKRRYFFGEDGDTCWNNEKLRAEFPNYIHRDQDIRDEAGIEALFAEYPFDLVIHAAAQPSHDWAAKEPFTDFGVNAYGTLVLLEAYRRYRPEAVFIFTTTNKVYGDRPNHLPRRRGNPLRARPGPPVRQRDRREHEHRSSASTAFFGASKVAADILVQEYGAVLRSQDRCVPGGCLTGRSHPPEPAAWFSVVPVQLRVTGEPYDDLRLQGQAGPGQHPRPRPDRCLLSLLP